MTQPEGDKSGRVREECCALKKKAVRKNLEFPVAFEPTLKGIMAAASGLSCGSRKKGFGQKQIPQVDTLWVPKFHCKSPPSYSPHIHTEQHTAKQRFCAEYPSVPTPITSNSCLTPLTPTKQKAFVSCLGSNIYRPLSTESETSHDFKKSGLGQKQSGEAFSLSALDLTGKIKKRRLGNIA